MINFEQYTIEQLQEMRNELNNYIYNYKDGYEYICNVRSYGRRWKENPTNKISVQELCNMYNGDQGIVDVYSTNPNLQDIQNYGDVKFIYSKEQYTIWKEYKLLEKLIPEIEKELEIWENRDNVPFKERPLFAPIYTRDNVAKWKEELSEMEKNGVVEPVDYPRD